MRIRFSRLNNLFKQPWLPYVTAIVLGGAYLIESWISLHTQESVLDEGAYLYKGFLFVSGQYRIYQDYGPWGNHMPLSFYIPGVVQTLFGPSLAVGRYFAWLLGALTLLGLWVLARRLGGVWWAALTLLLVGLSPILISNYSLATSQVLIACMLMWTLVFTLGDNRPAWQIFSGVFLASIMLLTRINLTPVLLILLIYVFWQHGSKIGWKALLFAGIVVLGGHLIFWPGILRMWAAWLPRMATPFLNPWRVANPGTPSWNPSIDLQDRLLSFSNGVLEHFPAVIAWLAILPLLFHPKYFKRKSDFRAGLFLWGLFCVLFFAHAWASLTNNYCVYCFTIYLTFFTPVGLLFLIFYVNNIIWEQQLSSTYLGYLGLITLFVSPLMGLSTAKAFGPWLWNLPLPRIKAGAIQPGSAPIGGMIQNAFGLDLQPTYLVLAIGCSVFIGILCLSGGLAAWRMIRAKNLKLRLPVYLTLLVAGLIAVGLLVGQRVAQAEIEDDACADGMLLTSTAQAGNYLADLIPAGSLVYWNGYLSVAPLLSTPGIQIYPPQINNGYSYRLGGDAQELVRFGLWNDEMKKRWLEEADYITIETRRFSSEWAQILKPGQYQPLPPSPPVNPCKPNSAILVFKRINP